MFLMDSDIGTPPGSLTEYTLYPLAVKISLTLFIMDDFPHPSMPSKEMNNPFFSSFFITRSPFLLKLYLL